MRLRKRSKPKGDSSVVLLAKLSMAFPLLVVIIIFGATISDDTVDERVLRATAAASKTKQYATPLMEHLIRQRLSAEQVWMDLIQEAGDWKTAHPKQSPGIVIEVGMHRAIQCLQAAKAGLEAHCIEPSPKSFERVKGAIKRATADEQARVHLYNVAAGGTSEGSVPFTATGGTGDHVGEHDMWAMAESKKRANDPAKVIEVPSKRLDDIINDAGDDVFLLKVDTQGFEPTVFSGLTDSLHKHKVKYILTEFWPRGMDLLAGQPNACIGAKLLQDLADQGYTLYALPVAAHPRAPQGWQRTVHERPLDSIEANCQWYFDVEKRFPSTAYKMGYWSDILAVAPGTRLDKPRTTTGRALTGK